MRARGEAHWIDLIKNFPSVVELLNLEEDYQIMGEFGRGERLSTSHLDCKSIQSTGEEYGMASCHQ